MSCSLSELSYNKEDGIELGQGALHAKDSERARSSAVLAQSPFFYQDNSGYFKPFAPSPSLTAHLFVKIAGSKACKETG